MIKKHYKYILMNPNIIHMIIYNSISKLSVLFCASSSWLRTNCFATPFEWFNCILTQNQSVFLKGQVIFQFLLCAPQSPSSNCPVKYWNRIINIMNISTMSNNSKTILINFKLTYKVIRHKDSKFVYLLVNMKTMN